MVIRKCEDQRKKSAEPLPMILQAVNKTQSTKEDEENFENILETNKTMYDPKKREPKFAGAEYSSLWELVCF